MLASLCPIQANLYWKQQTFTSIANDYVSHISLLHKVVVSIRLHDSR